MLESERFFTVWEAPVASAAAPVGAPVDWREAREA